jgi:hypothetical protein
MVGGKTQQGPGAGTARPHESVGQWVILNCRSGRIPALPLCGHTRRISARPSSAETHAQPQPEENNQCRMTIAPR